MKTLRALSRGLINFGSIGVILSMHVSISFADIQDSVFYISPDGTAVAFEVRDVPRREVVDRLLSSKAIAIKWLDRSLAEERVSGAFKGDFDSVLRRLLANMDFVAVSDNGEKFRISRITVVGRSTSKSTQNPDIGTAQLRAEGLQAPVLTALPPKSPALLPPSPSDRGPLIVSAPGVALALTPLSSSLFVPPLLLP
jgi:hypothetical protein